MKLFLVLSTGPVLRSQLGNLMDGYEPIRHRFRTNAEFSVAALSVR